MSSLKNILVVGGTGFIGEYLVRNLVTNKALAVSVIHHSSLKDSEAVAGVIYHQIDLTHPSLAELKQILSPMDVIVWSTQENKGIVKTTAEARMIANLIQSINAEHLKKIVYLSTYGIYPSSAAKQLEANQPVPDPGYEEIKFFEEQSLMNFLKNSKIQLCIARPGNVYGDVKNKGKVDGLIKALESGQKYTIKSDGTQVRDYIFVEDVAALVAGLIFYPQPKPIAVFNVCTGVGTSTNQLVEHLEKIVGKKLNYKYDSLQTEKNIVGDNSKILQVPGCQISYNLSQGLDKTYKNYLSNR